MFAASSALALDSMSSGIPRPTPQPLRRVATALAAAATILTLLAASAVPARADIQGTIGAGALVPTLAVGTLARPAPNGHALPAPTPHPTVQVRNPRVPAACAFRISSGRRDVTVYPERCLRRSGFDYRLPRQCAYHARVFGRPDRVYAEDCLRNAGFRVGPDRRHRDFGRDRGRGHGRDFGRGHPRPYY